MPRSSRRGVLQSAALMAGVAGILQINTDLLVSPALARGTEPVVWLSAGHIAGEWDSRVASWWIR